MNETNESVATIIAEPTQWTEPQVETMKEILEMPDPSVTDEVTETPEPLDVVKTPKRPKFELKRMAGSAATAYALKHGEPVASGNILDVPLALIVSSDNPRQEPASLCVLGYKLVDSKDVEHSLLHMALSDDIEVVRQFVNLIETHEAEPKAEEKKDGTLDKSLFLDTKTIMGLARSLSHRQIQAVEVRRVGNSGNYALVFGQRRLCSKLYNHAKSRVNVADGVDTTIVPAVIKSTENKMTATEAYEDAIHENFGRKDFTPLQEGSIYNDMLGKINPETGKKWNIRQIAKYFGEQYMHVRSRAALWQPRREPVTDDKGNLVRRGSGLTNEDRIALESGKKTLTWAVHRSLGEAHYSETGDRQKTRRKTLAVKDIQTLFDETPEKNETRRTALAECMCLTLAKATKESEKRQKEAAERQTNIDAGKGRKKSK